jgi:hypothetical protein
MLGMVGLLACLAYGGCNFFAETSDYHVCESCGADAASPADVDDRDPIDAATDIAPDAGAAKVDDACANGRC